MDSLLPSRLSLIDMNSQPPPSYLSEEKRVLDKSKSLLNWLTQRNFDKIKNEIARTITSSPSPFVIKSLVCCILDMAMVDNAYVLFSRLCVELFNEIPPFRSDESSQITTFERLFLCKCRLELEHSSPNTERPPLVFVEESECWRFIKTVRVLAEIFKNNMVNETTRQSIVQVLMNPITPPERNTDAMHFFLTSIGKLSDFQFSDPSFKQQLLQSSWAVELESNYNEEVKLRKEAQVALVRETEENELMKRLLESYKEEQGQLQLQAQTLEHKHQQELRLRKETEYALAMERERMEKAELQLETFENEYEKMRSKAKEFESKHDVELSLRKDTETALCEEKKVLEETKQQLEACKPEQEKLNSQVRTWQDKYEQESSLRKEAEDALSRGIHELEIVKGILESYEREADAMRQERDNALKSVQELTLKQTEEREPLQSFICPITQASL
ncbi:unnamed protein product [Microthlaspi erraticum]|uniref:MIF4G domain-containing protein n=1 Tax=Microthlaspi erraticum TaxID=1685480 RepID=A0A6D2IBN2_9BRAS|nr:unnamed protein product [Microthlaspi erraticum]